MLVSNLVRLDQIGSRILGILMLRLTQFFRKSFETGKQALCANFFAFMMFDKSKTMNIVKIDQIGFGIV